MKNQVTTLAIKAERFAEITKTCHYTGNISEQKMFGTC
jgi:hypothetical protein